jgi:hypothetical protein
MFFFCLFFIQFFFSFCKTTTTTTKTGTPQSSQSSMQLLAESDNESAADETELDMTDHDNANNNSSSSSSSSSSSTNPVNNTDTDTDDDDNDFSDKSSIHINTNSSSSSHNSCMSIKDYNRKLGLINELITLHKAKTSSSFSTTCSPPPPALSTDTLMFRSNDMLSQQMTTTTTTTTTSTTALLRPHEPSDTRITTAKPTTKTPSALDLAECTAEGERVCVANASLRADRDLSRWTLTRHVEHMPAAAARRHELPDGTVVRSGKALRLDWPFGSGSHLDFLLAIRNKLHYESRQSQRGNRRFCIKVHTRLVAPDGTVKALHTQEIPQFYQEIFHYANLIGCL